MILLPLRTLLICHHVSQTVVFVLKFIPVRFCRMFSTTMYCFQIELLILCQFFQLTMLLVECSHLETVSEICHLWQMLPTPNEIRVVDFVRVGKNARTNVVWFSAKLSNGKYRSFDYDSAMMQYLASRLPHDFDNPEVAALRNFIASQPMASSYDGLVRVCFNSAPPSPLKNLSLKKNIVIDVTNDRQPVMAPRTQTSVSTSNSAGVSTQNLNSPRNAPNLHDSKSTHASLRTLSLESTPRRRQRRTSAPLLPLSTTPSGFTATRIPNKIQAPAIVPNVEALPVVIARPRIQEYTARRPREPVIVEIDEENANMVIEHRPNVEQNYCPRI